MNPDLFQLNDRGVLVVGGAGGIGRAIVLGLAAAGADVVIADIAVDQAEEVAAEARALGRRASALPGNITDRSAVDEIVGETIKKVGRLDALVNTVGLNVFADMFDLSDADWDRVLDINLNGAFRISRAAARRMADQGRGSIVNFISVTALRGSPGQAAYAAAKAGLVNLTKSMALEWSRYGIRVNAVSPIMTETAINAAWLAADPNRKASIARRIPAGRLGKPEDFVGPVIFLVSEASEFMLGQTLYVDGGASVSHPLFGGN